MGFFLEIISPEGSLFKGEVEKISVPAIDGQITILPHHIPLFTLLKEGKIKITDKKGKVKFITIAKGLMEVGKNLVSLLVELPLFSKEEMEAQISKAKEKVKEIKKRKPEKELLTPTQAVRRSLIDITKIKKKKRTPLSA